MNARIVDFQEELKPEERAWFEAAAAAKNRTPGAHLKSLLFPQSSAMNVPIETPEINDISLLLLASLNSVGDEGLTACRLQVLARDASAPGALLPLLNEGLIRREAHRKAGFVYSITAKGQALARSLIAALKDATA